MMPADQIQMSTASLLHLNLCICYSTTCSNLCADSREVFCVRNNRTDWLFACPGFVDPKTNNFPGSTLAYCSDGISIVIGSVMGTSPVTVFVGELATLSAIPLQGDSTLTLV